MIGGHGQLDAILAGLATEGQGHAGIVNEYVDLWLRLDNISCKFAHGFL